MGLRTEDRADDVATAQVVEVRLARFLGKEITTPQGPGVLQAVEAGTATVLMDQCYTVSFAAGDLVEILEEVCALCRAPATEWCTACGQPVCATHQRHGVVGSESELTPYMLEKVLRRLSRHGTVTVRESEIAYAAAALARTRHLGGGVEVLEPEGARKGVRLVLRPA